MVTKKKTTKWEEKLLAERRLFESLYIQISKLEHFPHKEEAIKQLVIVIEALKKLQRIEG